MTGQELDRGTLKEINGLDERPASWVAKHLVMAGRYLDVDPALAFQHALAASSKGGRLSRVREAVALTAYAAGEYADALREFRTYRRMTSDDTHIAAQVDSERALGRTEKALQLAAEHGDRVLGMVLIGPALDIADGHAARVAEGDPADLPSSRVPFVGRDPLEHWAKYDPAYWREHHEDFLWFFFGMCFFTLP